MTRASAEAARLAELTHAPRAAGSRPAFTLILPTSPQVPTPNREFLLETPTEGVSAVATIAKLAGWDTRVRDLRLGEDLDEVCEDAARRGGVVAMPTFVDSLPVNRRVLRRVQELNPAITTLVGGALVSSLPEPVVAELRPDYAVLGEGELTLLDVLEHVAAGRPPAEALGIPGLALWDGERVRRTAERPQLSDLDALPIPDLSLFPGVRPGGVPSLGLTSSRGCYGRCTFCFLNMKKLAFKSPARFEREVAELVSTWGVRYFYVNDLTFTADLARAHAICGVLGRFPITWSCSTRVERIHPELLRTMHANGCRDIWYGVESLDQTVLDLANKRTRVEEIEYAVRETVAAGIQVMANLIVGLPGESEESLQRMMAFCRRTEVIPTSIKYLTPFPGTRIYDLAVERGFIPDPIRYLEQLAERKVNDVDDHIINLTALPDERLRSAYAELMQIRADRLRAFA